MCIRDREIALQTGWGIWSTYISPDNTDMSSIFEDIVGDLVIVKDENGSVYWPLFGLNSIGSISSGMGYQVKMDADATLIIEGTVIPSNLNIELSSGWGIIGYLHPEPNSAADMMAPIVEDLVIVKDENGSVYWPLFGLNSIGDMQAGKGYQIKMDADVTFSYPSGSGRLGYVDPIRTVHYDKAVNTGSNMTIALPTTAWDVMPAIGDEIAAYDESGRLIGSTSFNGETVALTVWGDDFTTDAKDGLAEGERVTFKLWNSDMNTESTLVVTKWDAGSDMYSVDGISIASSIILSGDVTTSAYKLYQNVPNPFNGTTTIKFYVPESADVTLGVYNMLGEFVADITSETYSAGKHEVVFNASELGQGTYFVRMTTDRFIATISLNNITVSYTHLTLPTKA